MIYNSSQGFQDCVPDLRLVQFCIFQEEEIVSLQKQIVCAALQGQPEPKWGKLPFLSSGPFRPFQTRFVESKSFCDRASASICRVHNDAKARTLRVKSP